MAAREQQVYDPSIYFSYEHYILCKYSAGLNPLYAVRMSPLKFTYRLSRFSLKTVKNLLKLL